MQLSVITKLGSADTLAAFKLSRTLWAGLAMSKRHRPDEGAPVLSTRPAQAEGDAEEDAHALTALAGWCDDQLRDVSHLYMRERDGGAASMTCSATMHAWADDQFGGFIDALESERSVQLSEGHRGALAAAWRRGALDAARVHCMRQSFLPDSPFLKDFHFQLVAADAARDIESAAGDLFDEWIFTLGWKLARAITDMCVEVDESEAEDEPVEESSEEEGEGESSGGGEGGSSSSGSDSCGEGEA